VFEQSSKIVEYWVKDYPKESTKLGEDHQTFQEQFEVADHIIVTKSDLYQEDLTPKLQQYLTELSIAEVPINTANQGQIDLALLLPKSKYQQPKNENAHSHNHSALDNSPTITAPAEGSIKIANNGQGYYSYGWICSPTKIFNYRNVMDTLTSLSVERLKAVLITEQGVVGCNLSDGCISLNMIGLEEAADSRIEFITQEKTLATQTCKILEAAFGLGTV
jgi:G3E family GTPase